MKKMMIAGGMVLVAGSSFAGESFECATLKDFSSKDMDLAVKMARSFAIEQISKSGRDVSEQIRAERSLELELIECKSQALQAKIKEIHDELAK